MAKGKCQPCMAELLKQVIRKFTDDPATLTILDKMATCPVGQIMDLCEGKQTRTGRKAGPYALFIGQCMRSKPIKGKPFGTAGKYMKECASEYKRSHGTQPGEITGRA